MPMTVPISRAPRLSGMLLRAQSDARLSVLAAAGSAAAFEVIHERYASELSSYASRYVRPDRADDVTQQAMLMAWGSLMEATEPVLEVRAWLYRIVHNTALNTRQRRGYDDGELSETAASSASTEQIAESRATAAAALAAIAALPDAQRRALTMTAIDGLDGRHVAQELGLSQTATRQLVHRARTRVRTSVSFLTPWPLLLLAVRGTGTGAGAGSAGVSLAASGGAGLAVSKLAAVAAVTAVAAGSVAATTHHTPTHHRPAPHAATVRHHSALDPRTTPAPIVSTIVPQAPAKRGGAASPRAARHASDDSGAQRGTQGGSHGPTGSHGTGNAHGGSGSSNRPGSAQHSTDTPASASHGDGHLSPQPVTRTTVVAPDIDEDGSSTSTTTVSPPLPPPGG